VLRSDNSSSGHGHTGVGTSKPPIVRQREAKIGADGDGLDAGGGIVTIRKLDPIEPVFLRFLQ
jgi:hypothetical protein